MDRMTTLSTSTGAAELDFLGCRARILVEGHDQLGLVDMIDVPAGHMPPLHVHHAEDEGFYVIHGEVTVFLPGHEIRCGPGDFAWAPRGVPHAYRVGDRPARWLVLSTPSGFERFVADVAALEEADPATLASVAKVHDIEILGPPGVLP